MIQLSSYLKFRNFERIWQYYKHKSIYSPREKYEDTHKLNVHLQYISFVPSDSKPVHDYRLPKHKKKKNISHNYSRQFNILRMLKSEGDSGQTINQIYFALIIDYEIEQKEIKYYLFLFFLLAWRRNTQKPHLQPLSKPK